MIFGGNTILFLGCMYRDFLKDKAEKYRKILSREYDLILLPNEPCCGAPLKNAGYVEEYEQHVRKVFEKFKKHSVKRIIAPCPACYYHLKNEYPKIIGKKWKIEVIHATKVLYDLLKKNKIKLRKISEVVTYHDPCHLGRYSGIYNEPREIIRSCCPNFKEMKLNRELSTCCGGGGSLKANFPEIANKIAKIRLKQAEEIGARYLITACPMCYKHLSDNSKHMKVSDIIDLVIDNLD